MSEPHVQETVSPYLQGYLSPHNPHYPSLKMTVSLTHLLCLPLTLIVQWASNGVGVRDSRLTSQAAWNRDIVGSLPLNGPRAMRGHEEDIKMSGICRYWNIHNTHILFTPVLVHGLWLDASPRSFLNITKTP